MLMKKIIAIAALVFGVSIAAAAQPRAIGLRGGYGAELSYQHSVGGADFLEADLGLYRMNAINVGATYNFMIAQPEWTDRGDWGFYAGPGAVVGFGIGENKSFVSVAAAAQVGLEYNFWIPLQISIDIRPQLGLGLKENASGFYFGGFYPCLAVRYKF
jgi:hypothetical protein